MVNTVPRAALRVGTVLVGVNVALTVLTLLALAVLSVAAPRLATPAAWGHAVIVAAFAVLLPLRLRSARTGRRSAVRAVGVIAAALLLVNAIEALLPSFVPVWMRIEMVATALLMAGVVLDVIRWAVREH